MCLITAAPKGTKKRGVDLKSFIENGMRSNTHGSGFSYKRDGQTLINIHKGFNTSADIISEIDKLKLTENDELIIHHRIGTSGLRNDINMHPFAVSETDSVLQTVKGSLKTPTMAHNGVFYRFSDHTSDYNDTYHFVKSFIAVPEILNLLTRDPKQFHKMFEPILNSNKLVFLFPKRDMVLIGDFKEEDGYFHSNGGYKSYVFDRGGSSASNTVNTGLDVQMTDEELEEYYGRNSRNRFSPNQMAAACQLPETTTTKKNDKSEGITVGDAYGRFIQANCYEFPYKHIAINDMTAHHFMLIVVNPSIGNTFKKNDVLVLTDYKPDVLANWVTNLSNHNTMTAINIEKCLKNGDVRIFIKKPMNSLYEGLYKLNAYITNKHEGTPPKSLIKNLTKLINLSQNKKKQNTDYVKFRDFGVILLAHMKKIQKMYELESDKLVKSSKDEDVVITNSEIVEDTAS